jgi:hypothetical protein
MKTSRFSDAQILSILPQAAPALCLSSRDAGDALRRCPDQTRLHLALRGAALLAQASDAVRIASSWRSNTPLRSALRLATTTASADFSLRLDAVALSDIRRDLPR